MQVDLDDVQVRRAGRLILDIPSLRLRRGVTTAILGPNGSGKTTLLRLIAGLEHPSTGRVLIDGAPVPQRTAAAVVFQEDVFVRGTVRRNLELALQLRGVDSGDRTRRIQEAADLVGVRGLLDRQADRLAGGEARRVSLARAFCLRAPLVLLDEPLAGLDHATRSRLLGELPALLAAFDATTLLVTHDRHEALRLAQDLVVLAGGRVHASGDKRRIATDPSVTEVAEVLGYMILSADGQRIAVPPDGLAPGPGRLNVSIIVDDVVDMVDRVEISGHVGTARVHMALPEGHDLPARGSHVHAHAARFCVLR